MVKQISICIFGLLILSQCALARAAGNDEYKRVGLMDFNRSYEKIAAFGAGFTKVHMSWNWVQPTGSESLDDDATWLRLRREVVNIHQDIKEAVKFGLALQVFLVSIGNVAAQGIKIFLEFGYFIGERAQVL